VVHTIGEPLETKRRPETAYQAQFSGPYTVAAGLLGGHGLGLGLDDFTDELARDPDRRALMAKVDVVADAEATDVFPRQFAAVLTAVTTGGERLVERVMTNRGGPQRPLSDTELALKFTDNASRALDDDATGRVRDAVWALSTAPDVDACVDPLARSFTP
jgi:2-methylcitrate dehydratase PrpD